MRPPRASWKALPLLALATLPAGVLGGNVISTDGFTTCIDDPSISVTAMNIQYDKTTNIVTFDVSGTSSEAQNVTAKIAVTAYGVSVYSKEFDPCDSGTYVAQLCPGTLSIYRPWSSPTNKHLQSQQAHSPLKASKQFLAPTRA